MKWIPLLVGALALGRAALADTATFFPSADTTISQDDFTRTAEIPANGSSETMIVGHLNPANGNVPVRGLLRFDITNLPPNVVVTSVTLRVTATTVTPTAGTDTHLLNRISRAWDESTAVWMHAGEEPWENPGGDYEPATDGSVPVSGAGTYIFLSTSGLIDAVQMWATNASSNFGWILRSSGEDDGHNARRFTTADAAIDKPTLEVKYTIAAPPADPVTLINRRISNNNFVFNFTALPGTSYTVQYKPALVPGAWTTLQTHPAPGSPTIITVQDPLTPTNRFYRVVSP